MLSQDDPGSIRQPGTLSAGEEHGQAARANCTNSWEAIVLLLRTIWVLLIIS